MNVETVLSKPETYSDELGLDLTRPEDRFKWFLVSILFAKRISAEIAKKTYRRCARAYKEWYSPHASSHCMHAH